MSTISSAIQTEAESAHNHKKLKTAQANNHSDDSDSDASSSDASASATSTIVDNPCWGSPTQQSLSHLLSQISRDDTILWESPRFVALHKPADVRMDGPHPATVHKLLTYWYPPPSVQQAFAQHQQQQNQQSAGAKVDDDKEDAFARFIQDNYHWHSHHIDNEMRPCHQLDYATSGVLLVARSRAAANQARLLLEQRQVRKEYLAVVQGRLVPQTTTERRTWSQIHESFHSMEQVFRRQRNKRRSDTFPGFLPASGFFQKWRGHQVRQQQAQQDKDASEPQRKKAKQANPKLQVSDEQWQTVMNVLTKPEDTPFTTTADMMWKQVKKRSDQKERFVRATEVYNDFLREHFEEKHQEEQQAIQLPLVFAVDEEETNDNDDKEVAFETKTSVTKRKQQKELQQNQRFFVCASIADIPHQFPVVLHPEETKSMLVPGSRLLKVDPNKVSKMSQKSNNNNAKEPASDDSNISGLFRPSLTECHILSYNARNNTTKVLLKPWSGRRHQLRIHMALLGHPIVGDPTYQKKKKHRMGSPRMCLHAHKLHVPGLLKEVKPISSPKDIKTRAEGKNSSEFDLELEAPDPF